MALEEEKSSIGLEMRSSIDCLRHCSNLAGVDAATLAELAAGAAHFSLPAGSLLYEQGDPTDGVYLLVGGRLGVEGREPGTWDREVAGGELVGETDWLLKDVRAGSVVARRDSELLWLPNTLLESATARSTTFAMTLARLAAQRVQRSNRPGKPLKRARVFVIVPNNDEIDTADLATRLVAELARDGDAELMWDVRASAHTSAWFHRIEEMNDFVVYVADATNSGWTRQCCRQADVILLAARARAAVQPWPQCVREAGMKRGARLELALMHDGAFAAGAAGRWLGSASIASHHHVVDDGDLGRIARLLTRRGVGLVLSGGGARGFAHLGIIRALREAHIPIDFVGGVSIGAVIAAGVGMGWSDAEMQVRYRRSFVDTNPVNDYTFPWVALTRGRKVSRLLKLEYGDTRIEDLRVPYFCISANLTSGRAYQHRDGPLSEALRASVAIPGVMPPVRKDDDILVDGAAINNLPVDVMRGFAPGIVIGSDVGADRVHPANRRLTIFQVLIYSGLINSAAGAAVQRSLADVLLKPTLANVDLFNWQAFDRAIESGYAYASRALENLPELPRIAAAGPRQRGENSLAAELERRLKLKGAGNSSAYPLR